MNNKKKWFVFFFLLLISVGGAGGVAIYKDKQEKKNQVLVSNFSEGGREKDFLKNNGPAILPKPKQHFFDPSPKPVNLPKPKPVPEEQKSPQNIEDEEEQENLENTKEKKPIPPPPSQPSKGDKQLEIKNGKVQVPKRWLYTTEMNDIVFSIFPPEKADELQEKGIHILVAGNCVFGSIFNKGKKVNLDNYKDYSYPPFASNEIVFIPVNVGSFHHSLLVYTKNDDTFRHYDSLGGCNFNAIKNDTVNGKIIEAICPQQSGDGWGSCGTYPPVITSILIKRYKAGKLNNPANWKINKAEFLAERDSIMNLVSPYN